MSVINAVQCPINLQPIAPKQAENRLLKQQHFRNFIPLAIENSFDF
jgi:hypothetical protein